VFRQIASKLDLEAFEKVFFHAGKNYRKYLIFKLEGFGIKCEASLENLKLANKKRDI